MSAILSGVQKSFRVTRKGEYGMIRPDTLITAGFALILPIFAVLPWVVAIDGSQVGLSGVNLAFGPYDSRPLEFYALAAVLIASSER